MRFIKKKKKKKKALCQKELDQSHLWSHQSTLTSLFYHISIIFGFKLHLKFRVNQPFLFSRLSRAAQRVLDCRTPYPPQGVILCPSIDSVDCRVCWVLFFLEWGNSTLLFLFFFCTSFRDYGGSAQRLETVFSIRGGN